MFVSYEFFLIVAAVAVAVTPEEFDYLDQQLANPDGPVIAPVRFNQGPTRAELASKKKRAAAFVELQSQSGSKRRKKGVRFNGENRYVARIYIDGTKHYIGRFKTKEEAWVAYDQAVLSSVATSYDNFLTNEQHGQPSKKSAVAIRRFNAPIYIAPIRA